jgi:hypothetical protein
MNIQPSFINPFSTSGSQILSLDILHSVVDSMSQADRCANGRKYSTLVEGLHKTHLILSIDPLIFVLLDEERSRSLLAVFSTD